MADRVSSEARSHMMSRVKGYNTKPELLVRRYLYSHGLRFRIHVKELPGKPDIVLRRFKTAIFVHGCFWHQHQGCKRSTMPTSNTEFWNVKLCKNVTRDTHNVHELEKNGWQVIVVWECELSPLKIAHTLSEIENKIKSNQMIPANDLSFK